MENALIKCHYLFLKITSVGGERYHDSCSHKDCHERKIVRLCSKMAKEGTQRPSLLVWPIFCKSPSSPPLSSSVYKSSFIRKTLEPGWGSLYYDFCVLASLYLCTVSQGIQHDDAVSSAYVHIIKFSSS